METRIPARLSPAEGRRFGLLVGGVFLLLGGVSWWRGHQAAPAVLWAAGGALVLGGLLVPGRMGPVHARWMALALLISRVTTPVFMGLIYFGLFTPMGLVRRVLGKNSLVRHDTGTFWVSRPAGAGRRSDITRKF